MSCPICKDNNILWLRIFSNNICCICYRSSQDNDLNYQIGTLTCGHIICKDCANNININIITKDQISRFSCLLNPKCPMLFNISISPPIFWGTNIVGMCYYCKCRLAQSWIRQNGNEKWYKCCMKPV